MRVIKTCLFGADPWRDSSANTAQGHEPGETTRTLVFLWDYQHFNLKLLLLYNLTNVGSLGCCLM